VAPRVQKKSGIHQGKPAKTPGQKQKITWAHLRKTRQISEKTG